MKNDILRLKNSISFECLLQRLGFENINPKTRRASCSLHHGENQTSFSWSNDDEVFYCFVCQAKGDKIDLIQQVNHCSFVEAIKILSGFTGIIINYQKGQTKQIDYSKYDFPTEHAIHLANRTIKEYYNKIILEISKEIENYSKIQYSIRNDNIPAFYKHVENILHKLDSDLSWWMYQRNSI